MTTLPINDVTIVARDEIARGAVTVEARVGDAWYVHEGPRHAGFFVAAQAAKLVAKVRAAGRIDPARWVPVSRSWDEIELEWTEYAMQERYDAA